MSDETKRFRLNQELESCTISAEFDLAGESPSPKKLESKIQKIVHGGTHPTAGRMEQATLLDRKTGHFYEIQPDGAPETWTWTRITWGLAPTRGQDVLAVFIPTEAALPHKDAPDAQPRTAFDEKTFLQTVYAKRKGSGEVAEIKADLFETE